MRLSNLLIGFIFGLGACTSASSGAGIETTEPDPAPATVATTPAASASSTFAPDTVPAGAEIFVRRQGGAGATFYSIVVTAEGQVEYEGVNEVATLGKHSGTASAEAFADAWRGLVSLDRDHRAGLESCRGPLDDGSAYTILVRHEGETLAMFGYLDPHCEGNEAHQKLGSLFESVIGMSNAETWLGSDR